MILHLVDCPNKLIHTMALSESVYSLLVTELKNIKRNTNIDISLLYLSGNDSLSGVYPASHQMRSAPAPL